MSDFSERIKRFREEHAGKNKTQFAEFIKTKQQYIGFWESGRNKPDLENLALIRKAYPELNIDWLLFGEGNMLRHEIALTKKESLQAYNLPEVIQKRINDLTDKLMMLTDRYDEQVQLNKKLRDRIADLEKKNL
jgi:transcriptional regulator with XRE-family HTH domain